MKHFFLALIITANLSMVSARTISDPLASKETVHLYNNLLKAMEKGFFIGHQDDLAYGVNWKYQKGRSEVKDITGQYPAVYGWELGDLELDRNNNLDGVPFNKMKDFIIEGYKKGSIITIGWHMNNLLTGNNAWDPSPGAVQAILPGGIKHAEFNIYLDKIAAFLSGLKGNNGEAVPVLWRPWHETTGNWFWWGKTACTDAEYIQLFRYSLDYLRKKKNVHNLIVGYNTGIEFQSEKDFLSRYPGDDYVDIISFDGYQRGGTEGGGQFSKNLDNWLSILTATAEKHHKIPAIGELGYNKIPDPQWFTTVLLPVFKKYKFSYVLFWRNAGLKADGQEIEYYIPYKGHPAENDFVKFYKDSKTFFQADAQKIHLYK